MRDDFFAAVAEWRVEGWVCAFSEGDAVVFFLEEAVPPLSACSRVAGKTRHRRPRQESKDGSSLRNMAQHLNEAA